MFISSNVSEFEFINLYCDPTFIDNKKEIEFTRDCIPDLYNIIDIKKTTGKNPKEGKDTGRGKFKQFKQMMKGNGGKYLLREQIEKILKSENEDDFLNITYNKKDIQTKEKLFKRNIKFTKDNIEKGCRYLYAIKEHYIKYNKNFYDGTKEYLWLKSARQFFNYSSNFPQEWIDLAKDLEMENIFNFVDKKQNVILKLKEICDDLDNSINIKNLNTSQKTFIKGLRDKRKNKEYLFDHSYIEYLNTRGYSILLDENCSLNKR